jgi:rod shape determining protein RodA
MGAQRWIDIGPDAAPALGGGQDRARHGARAYYDWLPTRRVSNPLWLIPPLILIFVPVALCWRSRTSGPRC